MRDGCFLQAMPVIQGREFKCFQNIDISHLFISHHGTQSQICTFNSPTMTNRKSIVDRTCIEI